MLDLCVESLVVDFGGSSRFTSRLAGRWRLEGSVTLFARFGETIFEDTDLRLELKVLLFSVADLLLVKGDCRLERSAVVLQN